MNKKYTDQILEELTYSSKKNGKKFVVLSEVNTVLNPTDKVALLNSLKEIIADFDNLSYPANYMYQFICKEGKVVDCNLSREALMFLMANYSAKETDKHKSKIAMDLAMELKDKIKRFYCIKRALLRKEFTEQTKTLRSMIKNDSNHNYFDNFQTRIMKMYTSVLSGYYGETETKVLSYLKAKNDKANYLDYISLKELSDLIDVQSKLIVLVENNPNANFENWGYTYAKEKKQEFINEYGKAPIDYPAHKNTPKKMLSDFNKLCKKYFIEDKNLFNSSVEEK